MTLQYLSGNRISGLSSDTKPTTVQDKAVFYQTDDFKTFDFTLSSTTWTERSSGVSSEFSTISAQSTTFNPTTQTGDMSIIVDNTNVTTGGIVIKVDGSTVKTVGSGSTNTILDNPTSSVSLVPSQDFDIATATQTIESTIYGSNRYALSISPNGLHLYGATSYNSNNLQHYILSTAYDLTTGSLNQNNTSMSVYNGGGYVPDSSHFLSTRNGNLYVFDMSNYDIASSTLQSQLASGFNYSNGCWMKEDGTKCAIGGRIQSPYLDGQMRFYNLSTPYDVTTASLQNTFLPSQIANKTIYAIKFNSTGTRLAVYAYYYVYVFTLSTAYDTTTATFDTSKWIYGSGGYVRGATIGNADTGKVYVNSSTGGRTWEWTMDKGFAGSSKVKIN